MPEKNATQRKIYFFRAVVLDRKEKVIAFSPTALMKCIVALPDTTEGRSMQVNEKVRLTAKVVSSAPARLLFGRAQLLDRPLEETKALEWKDLAIGEGGGTADLTHVAFYDNGIVGQVFNSRGPHISRLSAFLEMRCPAVVPYIIEFAPLIRADALARIRSMEKLREVKFTVEGDAADLISKAGGSRPLLAAAREVSKIGRPFTITVTISAIQDQQSVREVVEDVATNKALAGVVRQVHVKGSDYFSDEKKKRRARREEVDLMSKSFVFDETFVTYSDNKYTINDTEAFKRMDDIYAARRTELESAAAMS